MLLFVFGGKFVSFYREKEYIRDQRVRKIVFTALIASLYAVLTLVSASFGLSYSGIQIRISEALTILPVFTPYAITGLTIGCFISNLGSPFGIVDIVFGTLATFISAILTRRLSNIRVKGVPILAPLPPVVVSAVFVGAIISFFMPEGFTIMAFLTTALSIAIGQIVSCYGLGIFMFFVLKDNKYIKRMR